LGDWITPHGSESNITSPENLLFNNCYCESLYYLFILLIYNVSWYCMNAFVLMHAVHYITVLVAKISAILEQDEKADKYHMLADKLAAAVRRTHSVLVCDGLLTLAHLFIR
jgi:hypothetical protein